jgi:hypothetical protein
MKKVLDNNMDSYSDLDYFLRKRGLEEVVEKFREEKVNCHVLIIVE